MIKKMTCKHIILLLDASGSMRQQKSDIVGGVNEMIDKQRLLHGEECAHITFEILQFSHSVRTLKVGPLSEISLLLVDDYEISGSTALFDAMASTIKEYEKERNVVMVVATDGLDNTSRRYTYRQLLDIINEAVDRNWKLIYLSEDVDTFQQGESIGIQNSRSGCGNVSVRSRGLGKVLATGEYNRIVGEAVTRGLVDVSVLQK